MGCFRIRTLPFRVSARDLCDSCCSHTHVPPPPDARTPCPIPPPLALRLPLRGVQACVLDAASTCGPIAADNPRADNRTAKAVNDMHRMQLERPAVRRQGARTFVQKAAGVGGGGLLRCRRWCCAAFSGTKSCNHHRVPSQGGTKAPPPPPGMPPPLALPARPPEHAGRPPGLEGGAQQHGPRIRPVVCGPPSAPEVCADQSQPPTQPAALRMCCLLPMGRGLCNRGVSQQVTSKWGTHAPSIHPSPALLPAHACPNFSALAAFQQRPGGA